MAKVKTTVKDLEPLVESPGPVHLQQVLLFQVMVAQEVWRIHHLWRRPPKNSDLKNKAVSDFQTVNRHLLEECRIPRPSWIFGRGADFPRQGSGSPTVALA